MTGLLTIATTVWSDIRTTEKEEKKRKEELVTVISLDCLEMVAILLGIHVMSLHAIYSHDILTRWR